MTTPYYRTQTFHQPLFDSLGQQAAGADVPLAYVSPGGVAARYIGPFGRLGDAEGLCWDDTNTRLLFADNPAGGARVRYWGGAADSMATLPITYPGGQSLGYAANLATDGTSLYICDGDNAVIWKVALAGGAATIFAGTYGSPGATGDGGAATGAKLDNPLGLCIIGGDAYIADSNNNKVRRVDHTNGHIATYAGTGTAGFSGDAGAAGAAQLSDPYAVATDGADLYICDQGNSCVRRVILGTGIVDTVVGTGGVSGSSGIGGAATGTLLASPSDVAYWAGSLYIADTGNARVVGAGVGASSFLFAGGGATAILVGGAKGAVALPGAYRLAVDNAGSRLWLALDGSQPDTIIARLETIADFAIGYLGDGTSGDAGDGTTRAYGATLGAAPPDLTADGTGTLHGAVISPGDLDPAGGAYAFTFPTGDRRTISFAWQAGDALLSTLYAASTAPGTITMYLDLFTVTGQPAPDGTQVAVAINADSSVSGQSARLLAGAPQVAGTIGGRATFPNMVKTSLLDAGRFYVCTPAGSANPIYFNVLDSPAAQQIDAAANAAAPGPATGYAASEDAIATSNPTATLVASPTKLTDDLKNLKYEDVQIVAGAVATMNPATRYHSSQVTAKDTLEHMIARISLLERQTTFGNFHSFL